MSNPITLEDIERFIVGYVQTLTGDAAGVQNTLKGTEDDADHALEMVVSDAVSSWGSNYELSPESHWADLNAETQADLFSYVAVEIESLYVGGTAEDNHSEIIWNNEIRDVFFEWEHECETVLDEYGREGQTVMEQMSFAVNVFGRQCLEEMLQYVVDNYDEQACIDAVAEEINEIEAGI